jgi:hypothetical protein
LALFIAESQRHKRLCTLLPIPLVGFFIILSWFNGFDVAL